MTTDEVLLWFGGDLAPAEQLRIAAVHQRTAAVYYALAHQSRCTGAHERSVAYQVMAARRSKLARYRLVGPEA